MSGKTTIQVNRKTKNRLNELGNKGDTYDSIIQKLIENYEDMEKNEMQQKL